MGVLGCSPISGPIGFHPISSLPADVMHDLAEGVCPIVMVGLPKQALAIRLVTYDKKELIPYRIQRDRIASTLLSIFRRDLDGLKIVVTHVARLAEFIVTARESRMRTGI